MAQLVSYTQSDISRRAKKWRAKRPFFSELVRLDALSDDSEDTADQGYARLISKSRMPKCVYPPSSSQSVAKGLSRTVSAPQTSSRRVDSVHADMPRDQTQIPSESDRKPTMKRAKTTGALIEPKAEGPANKRRRTYAARTVPEEIQIFKGLVFFFFPNNDISAPRRLRIQRAQEYGATWCKSWGENVTHAIVDKGLVFRDLLTYLKLESLPSTIAVVDECYPSECIKFRSILNPTQGRFRVNGTPSGNEKPSPTVEVRHDSLPLKPSRKEREQTPTSHRSDDDLTPLPVGQTPEATDAGKGGPVEEPTGGERDALDEMIDETKAAKDLPLEPLEAVDEEAPHETEDDSDASQSEQDRRKKQKLPQNDAVMDSWQQKFACMQKHDKNSKSDNPNSRTIEVLQQMLDYYTRTSDQWRSLAYRKAISALRRQPKRIITKDQARSIPGIGPRLADKIEEIVFTNRLRRLENANYTAEDHILQEFLRVYGAGISQASRWVAQGYKSLEDLKTKASLSKAQRIGVDHYQDFSQRIPRQEVETHGEIVRRTVHKVDPEMQVIIGGSYRRGARDSGDVDVIITKPDATGEQIQTLMVDVVVPRLFKQGFLQASLASTSRIDGSKWHGVSALPGNPVWRRIDLLFVPGAEIGAALIYFTGNDIFNRSMRLLASKKGMRLNQRGLYADVLRGEQRAKLNTGRLLEGQDERRIFGLLGVPWREPEQRIC